MDKEDVIYLFLSLSIIYLSTYTHNGILPSYGKEASSAICNSVDGSREYYA